MTGQGKNFSRKRTVYGQVLKYQFTHKGLKVKIFAPDNWQSKNRNA
jgi:hypothetical protein